MVPWPILSWRFTENQGLLVSVQPVCVFQPYELLLQQYFWLTVKYILFNYLKTFSYIHMADKSQAFFSVQGTQFGCRASYSILCFLRTLKSILYVYYFNSSKFYIAFDVHLLFLYLLRLFRNAFSSRHSHSIFTIEIKKIELAI